MTVLARRQPVSARRVRGIIVSSDDDQHGRNGPELACPFSIASETIGGLLNCELADDPHYLGLEVQRFDDAVHGTGLLVFLQRAEGRLYDYYRSPGLLLDRSSYELGAGIGAWEERDFAPGVLEIDDRGVRCNVAFTDISGRRIEVVVDDRREEPRRTGRLLAPVGSEIDHPTSLLLVHLHGFDLVRRAATPPMVRIDGRVAATGTLPGQQLHGRELIKYAAPLTVITLNPAQEGPLSLLASGPGRMLNEEGIRELTAGEGDHRARLALRPSFPDVRSLPDQHERTGRWRVYAAEVPALTGGTWHVHRDGDEVHIELAVTEPWRPGPLPLLPRLVTTVIPVFRRWPTTYRWQGTVTLADTPRLSSGWERTGGSDGSYTRATGAAR